MDSSKTATGPLAGLRVVDFTALLQGPLATQILADLGADVIKIEKPGGEWMRHWGICMTRTHGETDAFLSFNRNKRSVEVNMADEEDVARLFKLIEKADVVVENFRPGVMDRMGFGYETLKKINPRLVYAASSGYGQSGPYVRKPGQDYLVQALTGAMWTSGRKNDPPMIIGIAIIDQFAGMHLALGILAAIQHRDKTGKGQRVDVDLLSCALAAQQQELTVFLNHGEFPERPDENIGHPGLTAPGGVYATKDGHMMLAMFPCPRLGEILEVDWLAQYGTNEAMMERRNEIYRRLAAHFETMPTAHWIDLLSPHDVWCAPVRHYQDLEKDQQVAHKKLITEIAYGPDSRPYKTVASPFTFSETPANLHRNTPALGQHTEAFRKNAIWPAD